MGRKAAARAERLATAKDWPAWPGDEHAVPAEQFLWAIEEMRQKGLSWEAALFTIDPIINSCDPAAWDRLLDELLEHFRLGTVSSPLATYLTTRLVSRCPDMSRLPRVAKLLELVLDVDRIAGREIGASGALLRAARYYYHWRRLGIVVTVREIAQHVKVSHTLVARWVAHWKRGEAYLQQLYRNEKRRGVIVTSAKNCPM